MRRLILGLAALFGVAALLAGCSSSSNDSTVTTVDPAGFLAAVAEPGSVTVDVRTPAEYAAGHVDGAINVDVEAATFGEQIAALATDTTYNLYCRSGRRSAMAADQMAKAGFKTLVNLDGGIADLQAAGATIVPG